MAQKRNTTGLVQNQDRTPSERRESAIKAGIASGDARRKKKALKEMMELALQMEEQNEGYRSRMLKAGWEPENMTQMTVITQGLIQKAKAGDVQAYNAIRDIIGEKPVDESKMELNGDIFSRVRVVRKHQEPDGFTANSEDDIPDD
jgi:hypothetical protein